jgi:hypothetical protein
MNKYKIYFIGERIYNASSEEMAIQMAEQHLSNIPKQMNMDISAISRDMGIK